MSIKLLTRLVNGKKIYRYSFGFSHPNVFAMYLFWTTVMYYYLKYEELSRIDYCITFLLMIFIYIFPNSRTSALIMGVLLIATLLDKKINYIVNLNILITCVFIFCILSIFWIRKYPFNKIDEMLSGRIAMASVVYENYGISFLGTDIRKGTPITYINNNYLSSVTFLDSTYYCLLLNYGIVSFITYITLLLLIINYLYKYENESKNKISLLMLILYAISETNCIIPIIGFPLLFGSRLIEENLWKKKLQ